MHKLLKATALLLIVGGSFSTAQAGPITYQINDYTAVQQGYTISGSITTDGTIGGLNPGNITAWTWTLSEGVTVYGTTSSSDAGAGILFFGAITASATEITMATPGMDQTIHLILFNENLRDFNGVSLTWRRVGASHSRGFQPASDTFNGNYVNGSFSAYSENPPGLAMPNTTTWVIATANATPEPASRMLFGLGALILCCGVHRRRQPKAAA